MGGGASRHKSGGGGVALGDETKDVAAGGLDAGAGGPAIDKRHSATGTGRTSFFNHGVRGGGMNQPPAAGGGPSPPQQRHPAATTASPQPQLQPRQSPAQAAVPTGSPMGGRTTASATATATATSIMVPPQHQERFTVIASNITGSPPDFRVPAPRPQLQDDALTDSIAAMYGEDRAAQELESEMFAHTAMSLGMEQEDLLFNLLYFGGEGAAPDINMAISNARDETVALHSENNTPYKLRPASATDIDQLKSEPLLALESLVEPDCAVCKDDMEIGVEVIFLPACGHCFHQDCLVRWVKLQGFCPVCRAPIGAVDAAEPGLSKKKPPAHVGRDMHALTIAVLEDEEGGICVGAGPSLVPGLAARPGDGPPGPPLSYRRAFDVDPASSQEDVRADVDGGGSSSSSSSSAAVVVADSPRVADAEIASAAALAASARDAAVALTTAAVASYSHKVMPTAESKDDYSKCGFTRGADSGKAYATNKGQKYVDDDDDDDDGGGSGARLAESKYDDGDDADENYIPSGAKSGKDE